MPNTVIQLKKSATPSAQPASLANGELALNFADGILYYKAANGVIAAISGTGTGGGSSSYGTINANGTLLLAAIPNDKFTVLPGDFITITGDAVNDTFTIGANIKPAFDKANAALANTTATLAGALTTTGQITANAQINITPAGGQEGGEIQLQSTGANTNWSIDAYQNNIRIFTTTGTTVSNLNFFHAGSGFVRMGVNRADPTYTVDVNGSVNASALFVNGVQVNAGTVDLSPANGYTNTSTTAANNYAGAMANAANAYATTINDANLVIARAYTNTSTTAANNYAGVMANSANAVATATFGTITNTTAAFAAANQAGVIANAAFAAGNNEFTFSNVIYAAVNSVFGVANAAYGNANSVAVSANNYAGAMANAANASAAATYATQSSLSTGLTSANNYAGVMANSANAIAVATFGTITNTTAAFAAANQAGVVANNSNTFAINTFVRKSGDTITGDLTVQGNVTISGNTTYVNTQTLLIGDALITLNNDIPVAVAPSEDAGIEVKRGSSANVSLLWREASDTWTFTNDGTSWLNIASNVDVGSANNYAGAMANAANIYATTINDANLVVARAYTNTSTTAANNYAGVMANSANVVAVATFGTITNTTAAFAAANQAGVIANAAFAAGNNEFTFSNTIYAAVNSVFVVANAAYGNANSVAVSANNYAGAMANAANGFASATFGTATNTTAAFAKANVAHAAANAALANTSGVYFNGNLFFPSGNVGIGLTTTTYKLEVAGSFAAQTKSFVISHPSKEGMFLRHGSLEGPENGVYVRGKVQGKVIELPDYWIGLVDEDTITVQLTAIGRSQNLYVVEVSNNKVFIDTENHTEPYCYFTIYGERKDVEKLVVEY